MGSKKKHLISQLLLAKIKAILKDKSKIKEVS